MIRVTLAGLLGSLVLALVVAVPAQAAEDKEAHTYLVLVGISKYADKQILPRQHAEADAQALYDLFTDKAYLGVDAGHVRLLLGSPDPKRPSEPATHENISKALRWAASSADKDDLVLFAFFGQGAPLGERMCYLASDSTFKDRAKNAVSATEIDQALKKLKSHRFCSFLDVNFKGFDPGKEPAPEINHENLYKEFLGTLGDEKANATGRVLFLATRGLRTAPDMKDHGVFTHVLVQGLKGAADTEGYEPDGVVTIDELVKYVNSELPALDRKYGKTKEERDPDFVIVGGRSNHFELTHNPTPAAKSQERLEKFDKLAAEQKMAADLVEEGRNLLRRMPKLEAYQNLRKDYQKLADGTLSLDDFTADRTRIFDNMKIKRTEAQEFAAKVIQATQVLQQAYVKDINQSELVAAAIRGLYQAVDEKIPQEIKDQLDKATDKKGKGLSEEDLTNLLADIRERLGKREDLDKHKDIDYALQRMMKPLDPYTTYIDPETLAQFKRETAGNFSGIGVQIRVDSNKEMLQVVTPIKDSPAYRVEPANADVEKVGRGLKTGDIITTITREVDNEGKPLDKPEVLTTYKMKIQDAVKNIVGKPGTKVKLTVEREGVSQPLEFEIRRGLVEVESVLGVKRNPDDSWDFMIDPENKIAYVRLTQFASNTYRDLRKVMEKLQKTGSIKGFILDLRFNPGGLLTSAVKISDLYIDDGLIVTVRPRVGEEEPHVGEHKGSLLDFPMVCLVNGHSASGSEIVAACLQDHNRAVILGERSYGKGSVQNIQPFEEGELKITIASYWRPSGRNINRSSTSGKDDAEWGVMPDRGFLVKLKGGEQDELEEYLHRLEGIPRRDLPAKDVKPPVKDRQLDKALEYLHGQIKIASRAAARKAG